LALKSRLASDILNIGHSFLTVNAPEPINAAKDYEGGNSFWTDFNFINKKASLEIIIKFYAYKIHPNTSAYF
jgi:hypothetical protein